MKIEFRTKLIECEGVRIKPPRITARHVVDKWPLGQLAHLQANRVIDSMRSGDGTIELPNDKLICINGGLISTFEMTL